VSDEQELTARERAVLRYIAEGADSRTIRTQLDLSSAEVRRLIEVIHSKLRVGSRTEIAEWMGPEIFEAQHDHVEPMTRRQLLAHLRQQHPVGFERHSPSNRLEELHSSLHRPTPPSRA
jgi:DNA-binding CsgD family transcriptional regulator